tara:strand:- start:50989 stop:51693 length:705 start_codon:yes stop_codon:yes gene_type:complete
MDSTFNNSVADFTRRAPVYSAVKKRRKHHSNIWLFDSPKIKRRFVITGDVAFMHIVLLEGDTLVEGYDPTPDPIYTIVDGETRQTTLDAHVFFKDRRIEWWEFKRLQDTGPSRSGRSKPQLSAQAQAASTAGMAYRVKTDFDLKHREILFDNWLTLCACITRCRTQSIHREMKYLFDRLSQQKSIRFGSLLGETSIDAAQMHAAVASALQAGAITTELKSTRFGYDSMLIRSGS